MSKEKLSAEEVHNEMAAKWLEKEWGIKNCTHVVIWHRTTKDMKDPEFYRQSRLVLSPIDLVDLLDAHVKKATEQLQREREEMRKALEGMTKAWACLPMVNKKALCYTEAKKLLTPKPEK